MTPPARATLARALLVAGVVVVVALTTLPGVASAALDAFRAVVHMLRGAGHGLLGVEDGFVSAWAVTAVTIPLPALVAVAVPTTGRRATGWAAAGALVLESVVALRAAHPLPTWVSLVLATAVGLLLGWLVLSAHRAREAPATARSRRIASWTIALYGIGVVLVGFTGSPVDAGAHPWLLRVLSRLHPLGVPGWFGYGGLEFSANVVFFVPLGLLVVLVLGAPRWWVGAGAGLLVSAAIETGQALFLPARTASFDDVLANTSGAVVGALLGMVLLGRGLRHARR